MSIQNSINNMLSTAGVASAGVKHLEMEDLNNQLKSINTEEESINKLQKLEPQAQKANEDYNAAVEMGNELEKSKGDMSKWAYDYSREEADKLIQHYGRQKADFDKRIQLIKDKLQTTEEIGELSRKGWMRK